MARKDVRYSLPVDNRVAKDTENWYPIYSELPKRGARVERRARDLRDVPWIARARGSGGEVALDLMVERKRFG
jgi:hypothetical protein